MGPPKQRSRLKSTRFWAGVGASLGLLATLWAAFVGKTIPELLAPSESATVRFHRSANAACEHLPQDVVFPYPGPSGRSQIGTRVVMVSVGRANTMAEQFNRRASLPMGDAGRRLLAVDSPVAYRPEYQRFVRRWGMATRDFSDLVLRVYGLVQPADEGDPDAYRRSLARLLDADQATFRQVLRLLADTHLLGLERCGAGLAGISREMAALNDLVLGRKANFDYR